MFSKKHKITSSYVTLLLFIIFSVNSFSQSSLSEKFDKAQKQLVEKGVENPLVISQGSSQNISIGNEILEKKTLYTIDKAYATKLMKYNEETLKILLPQANGKNLELKLVKADIFSPEFKVYASSNRKQEVNYERPAYYWGQVTGDDASMVAITITKDEISGMIVYQGDSYNLGKIKNEDTHILYREKDVKDKPALSCFTDEDSMTFPDVSTSNLVSSGPENCVNMYLEVDNTIFQDKGTIAATTDYITGVFNQVAIMYANESINIVLNELVIWNTVDPYAGPSSSNYLNQFQANLNGNFNGDLAHLVGYGGGGGIAYLNVLCNNNFGIGYSGIFSSYQNVPTYSWTVNVITHEIGHNLGSPHTHSCSWNGNNTAIDGCGPAAGYSEGCDAPVPSKGTIMSYCHLLGGVGIDLNLGFGTQPGNLIRSNVYNNGCLSACSDGCPNVGDTCNDNDPCTIGDVINTACNCEGSYVDNDSDGFCVGEDADDNDPCIPNGNNDGCTSECTDNTVTLNITLDNYPGETTWAITNGNGTTVASGGTYASQPQGSTVNVDICLVDGCYTFTINDSFGDGICCSYGSGSYNLSSGGTNLAAGGAFTSSESTDFCLGGNEGCSTVGQACNDNNICTMGEKFDADCNCVGGTYTDADGDGFCVGDDPDDNDPCNPDSSDPSCGGGECIYEDIDISDFESGWGIWNDGGSDCRRYAGDQAYADSGSFCVRLRDNTSTSTTTTDNLNLIGYEELRISFSYYPRSMDNANEDFWLQVSTNGGNSYTTVEEWKTGEDFQNDFREFGLTTITGPFTANSRLRFRCDASSDYDYIYLDDIVIEGCLSPLSAPQVLNNITTDSKTLTVYPNPVSSSENIIVKYEAHDAPVSLFIYNNTGELLKVINVPNGNSGMENISVSDLNSGSYLIRMESDRGTVTKPFIVIH